MRLKEMLVGFLLASFFVVISGYAGEPIKMTAWPSPSHENDFLPLQYIDLEFKLPRVMIGRVIVLGGHANLTITRNEESAEHIILFRTKDEFRKTYELFQKKGYFEGYDIHDAESFFDTLAATSDEPVPEALKTMRYVM